MGRAARLAVLSATVLGVLGGWGVPAARALPVTYTDFAAFAAALPGPATTLDFEGQTPGTLIPSGTSVGGITFSYDFGGVQLKVSDVFDTTSGTNFLGTDDADVLLDLDPFDLSFAPVSAIGMYFITADPLLDGDIALSAGGATASLAVASLQSTLPDGGDVYFLGVVDPDARFSQATVSTIGGEFFLYNVDDVVTAVPEPAAALLVLVGLAGLGLRGRRRGALLVCGLLAAGLALPGAARARTSVSQLQAQVDDHEARITALENAPLPVAPAASVAPESGEPVACPAFSDPSSSTLVVELLTTSVFEPLPFVTCIEGGSDFLEVSEDPKGNLVETRRTATVTLASLLVGDPVRELPLREDDFAFDDDGLNLPGIVAVEITDLLFAVVEQKQPDGSVALRPGAHGRSALSIVYPALGGASGGYDWWHDSLFDPSVPRRAFTLQVGVGTPGSVLYHFGDCRPLGWAPDHERQQEILTADCRLTQVLEDAGASSLALWLDAALGNGSEPTLRTLRVANDAQDGLPPLLYPESFPIRYVFPKTDRRSPVLDSRELVVIQPNGVVPE